MDRPGGEDSSYKNLGDGDRCQQVLSIHWVFAASPSSLPITQTRGEEDSEGISGPAAVAGID